MFWKRWSRRLGSVTAHRPSSKKKEQPGQLLPAEKTIARLLQRPELLLQIIEHTDVATALNLRLVNHCYRDLIDKYESSLTKAFVDELDDQEPLTGWETPESLQHLKAIHICRELARLCASKDRVPSNPYMGPEGIPADDPLGDILREQIARGLIVMWKLSHIVPKVNRLETKALIEAADSEDLKSFTHAALPWDQEATKTLTLLRIAEKARRKSLIQKLHKATDRQAVSSARQLMLRKMWTDRAATLSQQERVDFHLAFSRIPEDFTEADFPWEKQYDQHKMWNWVPASTEFDGELWFDMYVIQGGPYLLYSLWCEPKESKRVAAWKRHRAASAAVRDYEIASAIDTRSYLFTQTALGQTGLTSRARACFDRAYGQYCMERFYEQQGASPPNDGDPLAFLGEWRNNHITMFCFGAPDPNSMQRRWRQRAR